MFAQAKLYLKILTVIYLINKMIILVDIFRDLFFKKFIEVSQKVS